MLPKDFLSIEDLADYLNTLGRSYDLSVSRDHYKLHKDIYDLIIQGKINLVFHHTGHIKETICDNDIDEVTGKLKNCTSKTLYTSAYFIIYPILAREMLLDNKFTTTQGSFNLYSFQDGRKNPDVTHTFYLYDILNDNEQNITANDLYIPKNEIDKLFNKSDQTGPEQTIAKLESELAQANAENALLRQKIEDNKELEPNSQAAVTRLLNVLFYKADYDLQSHSGTTNKNIVAYSERPNVNTPITKGFLAPWIKRVQQLRIDTKTGAHDVHTVL